MSPNSYLQLIDRSAAGKRKKQKALEKSRERMIEGAKRAGETMRQRAIERQNKRAESNSAHVALAAQLWERGVREGAWVVTEEGPFHIRKVHEDRGRVVGRWSGNSNWDNFSFADFLKLLPPPEPAA